MLPRSTSFAPRETGKTGTAEGKLFLARSSTAGKGFPAGKGMAVLGIVSPDIGGIFSVFKGIGGTLFETTGLESVGFSGTAETDCEFKLLGSVTAFEI